MEHKEKPANQDVSVLSAFARSGSHAQDSSGSASEQFGKYVLTRSIGRGGFGEVFLGIHETSWEKVAIKVLAKRHRKNAMVLERFELEIKVGRQLKHPHILSVTDDGEIDGLRYFAAPFIEGEDLLHYLAKRTLPVPEAVRILRQVTGAVSAAHSQGYLHRDLKPANILIERKTGTPFVADFGLAKELKASTLNTDAMAVLGTQPYMPPEQADPNLGDFSEATDTYALGATLYHVLTGRTPFPRPDKPNRDILLQIAWDRPLPPSAFNPQVPPALDRICLLCLQKSPFDRYESADELAADLGRFEEGKPIRAKLPGASKRFYRSCQRHPLMTAALATSVCLAVAGGALARIYATKASDTKHALVGAEKGQKVAVAQRKFQEYVADMKSVPDLWQAGDAEAVRLILNRHSAIQPDMRGIEWYYWSHIVAHTSRTIPDPFRATGLAVSKDGRLLAGANDRFAAVYDIPSGHLLHRWKIANGTPAHDLEKFHASWLQNISISPDGSLVAAVCVMEQQAPRGTMLRFGSLKVWNVADGEERIAIQHDRRISGSAVSFSPDGSYVVAGGYLNHWYAWQNASGKPGPVAADNVRKLRDANQTHPNWSRDRVTDLRFSPSTVVTTDFEGEVKEWSWPGGEVRPTGSFEKLGGFLVAPGRAQYLLSLDNGTLVLKFNQTPLLGAVGRPVTPVYRELGQTDKVRTLSLSDFDLVTGDDDKVVRLWRINEKAELVRTGEFRGNTSAIACVAMGAGWVASADESGSLRIWPVAEGLPESIVFPSSRGGDGEMIATPGSAFQALVSDHELHIKNGDKTLVDIAIDEGKQVTSVKISPDGRYAVICLHAPLTLRDFRAQAETGNPLLQLWSLSPTARVLSTPVKSRFITAGVSFSDDGSFLAVTSENDGVRLIRTRDGTETTVCQGRNALYVCISPKADYLAVSGAAGAGVWSIPNGRWIYTSDRQAQKAVFNIEREGAPRVLFLGNYVDLIDLATGHSIASKLANLHSESTGFSQDGRRLYSVESNRLRVFAMDSDDGTLLLDVPCSGVCPSSDIEALVQQLQNSWESITAPK